jgi:DNA invertase Pin-like site-specific DNA recombinase
MSFDDLSKEQNWRMIVTDMGIDTRTPMGKAMAHMAVVFAHLERDFIRMRTREALQVKKENGVTLGRPRSTPDDVVARVVRERTEGKTAYAIARDLNSDAVPTAQVRAPGRSYSPRPADAGRRSLIMAIVDCAALT